LNGLRQEERWEVGVTGERGEETEKRQNGEKVPQRLEATNRSKIKRCVLPIPK
jgi:hypothetical protein